MSRLAQACLDFCGFHCHLPTGRCTTTAHLGTGLHLLVISKALTIHSTHIADFGTHATGSHMQRRVSQHEIGTGLTNLGTIQHQGNVSRVCVLPALLQTVGDGVQASAMAVETGLNALRHFRIDLVQLHRRGHGMKLIRGNHDAYFRSDDCLMLGVQMALLFLLRKGFGKHLPHQRTD
jgi:hypothetical protein